MRRVCHKTDAACTLHQACSVAGTQTRPWLSVDELLVVNHRARHREKFALRG